ncbi:MAG: chromosomal replication initiator protein DnaA [Bacteroidetes bacterium]|nr:chromosomal replication initiator protein DnaA [Bacteroidota bacterium]MCB0844514.1 chromosomal replication initiator protein DnaA [Bacteroidota bacterium]
MTTNHVDIWNDCLKLIENEISDQSFDTWFKPIKPVKFEKNILTIEVPSQFFYEWLEEHYLGMLKSAIHACLGPEARLEYSIVIENSSHNGASTVKMPTSSHNSFSTANSLNSQLNVNRPIPNPFVIPGIRKFEVESNLNSSYTFDSYIEGDCNRLARSAGYAVANKPGITAYNPLFIYSGVGLGKTHLLQAIGNQIKELSPRKAVLYVSSERFINQFVEAVRKGTVNDFMNFYQMIDVLLVDDIQFLSGKEKTQDNFFHVFNHLRQSGKQIVLASDRSPNDMEGMEERLLSRFKWGLSTSLQSPDYSTRKQILKSKMYQNGIELPEEVVEYIAHNITTNIRELEGAMISLLAQSSLNRKEVDLDLARSMLQNFVDTVSREVTIDAIQQIVGDHLDVEVELMKAKTRKRDIVQARQIAMFFAKEMTRHSLKSIGSHFGGRDHSTVIHALQTVNDLIATDKYFKQNVNEIRKRLSLEAN